MKVQIDEKNFALIDPDQGARILELVLSGHLIIKAKEPHDDLGSGSYLMLPWVNRIASVPYTGIENPHFDSNKYPLHGLYVNSPRNVSIFYDGPASIRVELTPKITYPEIPKFKENLLLRRGSLLVRVQVDENEGNFPYCFGYHPYLQIDEYSINDLDIHSDISTQIQLNDHLIPAFPFNKSQTKISSHTKYDSLFQGGNYLELISSQGTHLKITSDLKYWQIYTPPDGKRIAVEPLSFSGNIYLIQEKLNALLPNNGSFQISVWDQQKS